MVVVAIVGGTGSVGKALVDAFAKSNKHDTIVLARKVSEGASVSSVFEVDYNNVEQLSNTLEENSVHTVICTIAMMDAAAGQAELNIIAAAAKSPSTERFVGSNWVVATPNEEGCHCLQVGSYFVPLDPYAFYITLFEKSVDAVRKTDLEWTQIYNGLFLDYYGMPHVEIYLSPFLFAVDPTNMMAAIPGSTRNELISFTDTKDLGKFVVTAMDLPKWNQALNFFRA
ncbi:NmrA-like family protein [Tothia fuscella]|uniref:NmrA-like family protein n=1 Tax=Tothia fuscella TaxID=1048955 RepID=A0A9P4NPE9_9PEZI|nr:NmrA-like family protein [Tothia fuscella]